MIKKEDRRDDSIGGGTLSGVMYSVNAGDMYTQLKIKFDTLR